jgi:peptidoglycan hydrolase-like protein with peptidoglycan-binding domain
MAQSGLARIDGLFEGTSTVPPVAPGDTDKESVGAIQDLLRGHGQAKMPGPVASDYGVFGGRTTAAVQAFRGDNGLPDADQVDSTMMQALIRVPAKRPIASRPYVTLGLDFIWNSMTKVLLLTSILEGKGAFAAMNLNSDKAGMSYGIIQWAQKPKRLHEILQAFHDSDSAAFIEIFGGGDAALASGLLNHTAEANGGIDPATGATTDEQFDLIDGVWTSRFLAASLSQDFQKVQINTARVAFDKSLSILQSYAPEFKTERAVAFMLDVANQFGDGGAKSLYLATKAQDQTLAEHIKAIGDESVNRMRPEFQAGTRNRREVFLETSLLADSEF